MTANEAIKMLEIQKPAYGCKEYKKPLMYAYEMAIKALEEVQQYRAIGTPEELQVAMEKQIPKKPIINYINTNEDVTEIEYTCSVCGTNFVELTPCKEWCPYCGNKIDWSDEE